MANFIISFLESIAPITAALVFILLFGRFVDNYIQKINKLSVSEDDEELMDKMNKVLFVPSEERSPNKYLGIGERILFFIAFNTSQPLLIGSWLAFKLASKWQTWSAVIKLPEDLQLAEPHKELEIRNRYGTNLLQRWLIGTMANIIVGYLAFAVANALGGIINA